MIGVVADPSDHAVAEEFFELFKTPWEFYRGGREYDILLCTAETELPRVETRLVVVYSGSPLLSDAANGIAVGSSRAEPRELSYLGVRLPVYGESMSFRDGTGALLDEQSHEELISSRDSVGTTLVRIGYGLFDEVRTLLADGQPVAYAAIPALDVHIAVLRDLIMASSVPLIEIPPVPAGYSFAAVLTHDVDHPLMQPHMFDHTMLGFLYRATVGSIRRVFRGSLGFKGLIQNWTAALTVPFVHLGIVRDFWKRFERYVEIEDGRPSTFFVIPFKHRPGRNTVGAAPHPRGAGYGAADIAVELRRLQEAGCEIALHGIDAWLDASQGVEELAEIRRISGAQRLGVRMHWLYFDRNSPPVLEAAGADYDSTAGYNETIGYRAGTAQVYKPLNASRLLELPLHIMDTALFYPTHLDLSETEAKNRASQIVENAARSGGCVTVNWHDRSISPERLWGGFYLRIVAMLEEKGAWFATASQAVAWFRCRRSAVFETIGSAGQVRISAESCKELPDLQLRIYNPGEPPRTISLGNSIETCAALPYQLEYHDIPELRFDHPGPQ